MLAKILLTCHGCNRIFGSPVIKLWEPLHRSSICSLLVKRYCQNSGALSRIIGKNGENLGLMTYEEAKVIALHHNLMLTQVAQKKEKTNPLVYKMIDRRVAKEKKTLLKEVKKVLKTKELTLKSSIDKNDLLRKIGKVEEFLHSGHQVTIKISRPGRSQVLPKTVFDDMISKLNCKFKIPNMPKQSESYLRCSLIPRDDEGS